MEEHFFADRTYLRQLLQEHPQGTVRQLMDATGRSRSWVKKWRKRLRDAPMDDEAVLHGQSRARRHPPEPIHPQVVDRILEIRDHPPDHLQRIPGPKAILYYLHRDETLQASGWHVPTSTSTIWRILDAQGRIAREPTREHVPVERPEPMRSWQIDFKDVSSVPADPEGQQQHVVETLNVVDVGTSILVEAVVRGDFTNETVLWALTHTFLNHGLPERITFDRDPRFVGSWSGRDFPSAVMRFLFCLGLDVQVCPAQRPDLNAFVERYHRSYGEECLAVERPQDQAQADEVTQRYRQHFNWERPNQAITCHNQPPRVAFPTLPRLPALPESVDPDRWLAAIDGRRYRRRVTSRGTIQLDNRSYYVQQALAGQFVTVRVDAAQRQLVIEHDKRPIKQIAIKGLYREILNFETYFDAIREEARLDWRRMLHERQRRVAM
jgi:hypothetical protein